MISVEEMVRRARIAQEQWGKADQETLDAAVREIGKTVFDNAEELARLTVEETKLGNYEDNLSQDKRKAEIIWHSLKGKKSTGIIGRIPETGIVEIARPVGVVGVILPVTIPVTNFMSNAMFSLKCGNAVIFAPHPSAQKTVLRVAELTMGRLAARDVPENIIQVIEAADKELSQQLMRQVDVVVATGGMAMVKAAYSSGRPAYGVGPGNVQAIIDRGVDYTEAAQKIIAGRSFNYGIPCASDQAVMAPREDYRAVIEAFKRNKADYVDDPDQIGRLAGFLFPAGELSRESVGISAYETAKRCRFEVPKDSKILLVKGDLATQPETLRREKLSPITMIYPYDTFEEAVDLARSNLELQGKGHSVVIFSDNQEHIEQFALAVYVSRIVVNQTCNFSAGGGFTIGFSPTTTLGCGTWENNVISENLTYKHLMNVCRIGYPVPNARIPTSEEIWG